MSCKLYLPRRSKFQLVFLRDDSLIFSFASRMIDFEGILSSLLILCLICSNNNCAAFLPISKVGCSTLVKLGSTINASFDSEKPTTAISSGILILFLKSFHRPYRHRIIHCKDSIRQFFHFKNLVGSHYPFFHHYSTIDNQSLVNRQSILSQGIHIAALTFLRNEQIFRTRQMDDPRASLPYQMLDRRKAHL